MKGNQRCLVQLNSTKKNETKTKNIKRLLQNGGNNYFLLPKKYDNLGYLYIINKEMLWRQQKKKNQS